MTLSLEQKWELVKAHYESAYRDPQTREPICFRKIPDPSTILMLFDSMQRLALSERKYLDRKRLMELQSSDTLRGS